MKKHTHVGDLVFEPFSGSGSQLIAAERTGRRCRAIEISPPFVDVAIRRWQKATGNEATLDGDGRTFAEIAVERGARRLFLRYDALREQIDHEDRDWWWELEEAVFAFSQEGVLPEDELMRDAVLADAEMDALFRHSRGRDVGEQMALLDAAARARGAKREAAIERVQHFVRAGIAAGVVG
jgi:hypothetical protein